MYSSSVDLSSCREGKAALFPFAHGRIKLKRTYIQQVKMFKERRKEAKDKTQVVRPASTEAPYSAPNPTIPSLQRCRMMFPCKLGGKSLLWTPEDAKAAAYLH